MNACLAAVIDWNWSEADRLFARAAALSSGQSRLEKSYLAFLASQRRMEVVQEIERMLFERARGDVIQQQVMVAELALVQGSAREAEQYLLFALHMSPAHAEISRKLAEVYEALGEPHAAHKIICALKDVDTTDERAIYWGLMGHTQPARRLLSKVARLRELKRDARSRTFLSKYLVRLGIAAGQLDEALHWLETAIVVERDRMRYGSMSIPYCDTCTRIRNIRILCSHKWGSAYRISSRFGRDKLRDVR